VSEAVVHRLEVVEVDEQNRESGPAPPQSRNGMREAVFEERAVGQPSQRVVEGLVPELLLECLALADVPAGEDAPRPIRPNPV
jgi:hypothetical protein